MRLEDISFAYGEKILFDGLNITCDEGKITAVLGGSGVGKTTLLRLLAGLDKPSVGAVERREVAYIFQEPRLMPTVSVLNNLTAIPRIDKDSARHWLSAVGLGDSLNLLPHELSGGMAQRVSMARAFAYPSDLLLMDEPFKGLDLSLRARLYAVFLSLWSETEVTTVLVTHDPEEAVALGHKVVVLAGSPAKVVFERAVEQENKHLVYEELKSVLMGI
jgi:NitT/TauT family transport system ATP-binding protein